MRNITAIILVTSLFASCNREKDKYDASGTFEAVETIVSAEASGVIRQLQIGEGQELKKGQMIGYIDSTQLHLRRKQMEAQIKAVLGKTPNVSTQVAAMEEQLVQANREQQRLSKLVKADAATQKQLDDVNTQIAVLEKQIAATRSSLGITSSGLNAETVPLQVQIEQLDDQISKCRIVNPIEGTVLVKYAEENEMTMNGKALYKIADMHNITLRCYLTGDQLTKVGIGQNVTVLTDDGKETYKEHKGRITWISDKAEFTPKTIQTKDERANLVYAMKISLVNDGSLKIGMYGEVKL
jgi:HlyD family secretion protein